MPPLRALAGATLLLTLGLPTLSGAARPTDPSAHGSAGQPSASGAAKLQSGEAALGAARKVLSSVRDKSMDLKMRVVDASGGERVKTLRGYEKHAAGSRKVLWLFESPMELQGTGFLAWQNEGRADSLWVYFPGQRRVRRVPASLRREQFQGSMFTYEDLITVFFLDYNGVHTLIGEEECGSSRCLLVETKLEEGVFAYDRLRLWLNQDTLLPDRVEFHGDELLKVMTVVETRNVDGIPSIAKVEMSHPSKTTRTFVEIEKIVYNQDLRNNLFTVEHLSQAGK